MARSAAGRVSETRHGIADTIRENPIPAAMVGIGLGWLLYNGRRSDSYGQGEMGYWTGSDGLASRGGRPGMGDQSRSHGTMERATDWTADATSDVRERAQDLTSRAQETVDDLVDRSRETTTQLIDRTSEVLTDTASRARSMGGELSDRTRYQAHRLEDRFHGAMAESPLVVGAAALALGLTAGLAIPSTRREAELMGPARDRIVDRAREMAEDTSGRVRQVAERVMDEAQTTAREVGQELKSTAREAAQEQGLMSSPGGEGQRTTHTGDAGNSVADPRGR